MKDSLSDFIDGYLITKSRILREIDEETAYVHYLSEAYQLPEFDLELRKPYHSPIRTYNADEKPSFSVFENTRINTEYDYRPKYLWKDSGGVNSSGDIFKLVRLLYDFISEEEVFRKIDNDFGLNLYSDTRDTSMDKRISTLGKIIPRQPSSIRIKSKPFTLEALIYWRKYGIKEDTLLRHKVSQVDYFWTQEDQQIPYSPKSTCFAYRLFNKTKLYTPGAIEFKFINDYPDDFVEGWEQLKFESDLLIITKSKKDVMVLDTLGYEAVSPKSETTLIPEERMNYLLSKYKRVLILFDNDYGKERNVGIESAKKMSAKYLIPWIIIPNEYASQGAKDISDFVSLYKRDKTENLLKELLCQNPKVG